MNMYRKKTVLLCQTNSPSVKPIGVAGFVSDGKSTRILVNVGGLSRSRGFVVAVEADEKISVQKTERLVNFDMRLSDCLLEKAFCLVLDGEDLSPLCFGSSHGYYLTDEILKKVKDRILPIQKDLSVAEDFFDGKSDGSKNSIHSELQKTAEVKSAVIQTAEPPKDNFVATKSENLNEGLFPDVVTAADTQTESQYSDEANGATADASALTETEYENFVTSSDNYFEGVEINFNEAAKVKAKVSLSEYLDALQRFYQQPILQGYYTSVKEELQKVFDSFSPYSQLMEVFEGSYFVKITDKKGRFFALGLLTDNGQPTHICYALPKNVDKSMQSAATDGKIPNECQEIFEEKTVQEDGKPVNFCFVLQSAADGKLVRAA